MKNYYAIVFGGLMGLAMLSAGCQTTTKTTVSVPQFGDSNPPAAAAPALVDFAPSGIGFRTKYDNVWRQEPGDSSLSLRYVYSDLGALSEMTVNVPSMPAIAARFPGMITLDRVQGGYVEDMNKRLDQVQVVSKADQMVDGIKGRRVKITAQENHESKLIDVVFAVRNAQVYIIMTDCSAGGIDVSNHAMNTVISNWKWNG